MELDDGVTVRLGAGDTIVQSGTRHAWHNPGADPCRLIAVQIGAKRAPAISLSQASFGPYIAIFKAT